MSKTHFLTIGITTISHSKDVRLKGKYQVLIPEKKGMHAG